MTTGEDVEATATAASTDCTPRDLVSIPYEKKRMESVVSTLEHYQHSLGMLQLFDR